ncbi:MAG: hypothetical protein AB7O37_07235 [Vicinamibacteria bacterium]
MLLLLALLLASQPQRSFAEERQLLDQRLAALRRLLPDQPAPQAGLAAAREAAAAAQLAGVELVALPPVEEFPVASQPIEISATGRYADADRFFRQLALDRQLPDVARLTLTGTPEALVRFTAVVRFPWRPARAPLPAPPAGVRLPTTGLTRAQADGFLRDEALALAKTEAVAGWRRARRNPRLFLAELAAIVRERPVVLTSASLADEFQVRGLVVGEAPSRALEARFERGFFRVADFLMVRQGACRRFEARGTVPVAGPEAELPLPSEDPFRQDAEPCKLDRDPARASAIRAEAPARKPGGPLTLRLRDVDLADLFLALHHVTGEGFVVDGDVRGRLDVELGRLSLEEVIAALRKAGLRISEPSPLRRVSLAAIAEAPASPPGVADDGRRASFGLKRADVREVLALMSEIDPELAALGPVGFLGRLSLFARETPLREMRRAVIAASGLDEASEDGRSVLRRTGGAEEALVPVAASGSEPTLVLRARDLDVSELGLAGIATAGSGFVAFAYGPTGTLNIYRAGDRLADAEIRSIDATGLVVETDEGRMRFALPPLGR